MFAFLHRPLIVHACLVSLWTIPGANAAEPVVIDNVAVIDVVAGKVIEGRRVTIAGEKIESVEAAKGAPAAGAKLIEGKGLFLMPGLFDSHVHYVSADTYGPMCIAHGVTFVRDMGGATEQILPLRDELNRGDVLGPEMIATGAIIDGKPPIWPFSEAVETPEEARAAVQKLAKAGVNQIKVYSKLPRDAYLAACDEAHKHKLKPVGHIPLTASLEDALSAGQKTVEHLEGFDALVAHCAGEAVPDPRDFRHMFSRWELLPKADKAKLQDFYRRMAAAGMAVCPTMVVMKGIGQIGLESDSPWLAYVPGFMRGFWNRDMYKRMAPGARAVVPLMQSVVRDLHAAGVPILCGTDLANPNVIPGYSVHEELELLQGAGLPAVEALRSATITPAKVFDVSDRLGSIAPGKAASFVLVRANPLEDVVNARKIEGVFLRGKHFDRATLDGMLDGVKKLCAEQPAKEEASGSEKSAPEPTLELPGEVVRRGRYVSTFMEFNAGTEDFIITKTLEGYSIKTHLKPLGGPQKPSIGTFHYDAKRRLRNGVWETTGGESLKMEFNNDGKAVVAKVCQGEKEPTEQRVDLPPDWLFAGPFTALEFAGPIPIEMTVGQEKTYVSVGFGFTGSQMAKSDVVVRRLDDRPLKRANGDEVNAKYFTTEMTLPMGKFLGETWTDGDGVVLKSVLKMPFGTVSVELE